MTRGSGKEGHLKRLTTKDILHFDIIYLFTYECLRKSEKLVYKM